MQVKRPLIKSQPVAIAAGLGAFVAGWICLHDAYEGRGQDTPRWLRPFTWW